jgi:hypothetical protein
VLRKVKKAVGEFLLRRRFKKHSRTREVKNLLICESILVLAGEPEDMGAMFTTEFVAYLRSLGKDVTTLFIPVKKKLNEKSYSSDIKLVMQDDLNLFYIPKNPEILQHIEREFDLLIDLSLSNSFTLKYIHALSMAKFKVGAAVNYKIKYSDLTIEIKNNPTVEYLLTQLKHYLTNINKNVA